MSEQRWTPGPWVWGDAGNGEAFLTRPDDDNPDFGTIVLHGFGDFDEDDARLIAAAPEMEAELGEVEEMLTSMLIYVDDVQIRHTLKQRLEAVRQVRAKVRGE